MEDKSIVRIRSANSYKGIEDTVKGLIDKFPLSYKNARVVIKPNILGGFHPDRGITTHPAIVRAVLEFVLDKGGKPVVGDNPGVGGYGRTEKAGDKSGIKEVSGRYFVNFAQNPVKVKVSSRFFNEIVVSKEILDADIIISIPKFKTHSLTIITGAIKNMFGIVVGAEKSRIHSIARTRDEFSEAIIDIFLMRKPEITLMDGVIGMEGNGPTSGGLRRIGSIIASTNGFAIDTIVARIMGIDPFEVPFLKIAGERSIFDCSKDIRIEGEYRKIKGFKKPLGYIPPIITNLGIRYVNRFIFKRFTENRLVLKEEICTRCGLCVKHCPVGAMKQEIGGFPWIEIQRCINCYCCSEVCPECAWHTIGFWDRVRRYI